MSKQKFKSLEGDLEVYFKRNGIYYEDGTNSYNKLDFRVKFNNQLINIEAKQKNKRYSLKSWELKDQSEEHDTFIVDDLTIRKMLFMGYNSFLVVWNKLTNKYYFATIFDLMFMSKERCNRQYSKSEGLKGKCIIKFSSLYERNTIDGCFNGEINKQSKRTKGIIDFTNNWNAIKFSTQAYNLKKFNGHNKILGIPRTKDHRIHDRNITKPY